MYKCNQCENGIVNKRDCKNGIAKAGCEHTRDGASRTANAGLRKQDCESGAPKAGDSLLRKVTPKAALQSGTAKAGEAAMV